MKLYILKKNIIYHICNCPKDLVIPTNDFEAHKLYKKHNYL